MRRAELATGIAYSTIQYARKRRVTLEIGELLCNFSGGMVRVDDIVRRRRRPTSKRSAA